MNVSSLPRSRFKGSRITLEPGVISFNAGTDQWSIRKMFVRELTQLVQ